MGLYKLSESGTFKTSRISYKSLLMGNASVIQDKGSMYPLGVFTLAADQATIEFTNIPQTYTHLQIRMISRGTQAVAANDFRMQINGDTGSNYGFSHYLNGDGASATSSAINLGSYMNPGDQPAASATSGIFGANIIDILDYRNANKFKTFRTLGGADRNGAGSVWLRSGLWRSSSAITSISIYVVAGNFAANSSFALYGVQA